MYSFEAWDTVLRELCSKRDDLDNYVTRFGQSPTDDHPKRPKHVRNLIRMLRAEWEREK